MIRVHIDVENEKRHSAYLLELLRDKEGEITLGRVLEVVADRVKHRSVEASVEGHQVVLSGDISLSLDIEIR